MYLHRANLWSTPDHLFQHTPRTTLRGNPAGRKKIYMVRIFLDLLNHSYTHTHHLLVWQPRFCSCPSNQLIGRCEGWVMNAWSRNILLFHEGISTWFLVWNGKQERFKVYKHICKLLNIHAYRDYSHGNINANNFAIKISQNGERMVSSEPPNVCSWSLRHTHDLHGNCRD